RDEAIGELLGVLQGLAVGLHLGQSARELILLHQAAALDQLEKLVQLHLGHAMLDAMVACHQRAPRGALQVALPSASSADTSWLRRAAGAKFTGDKVPAKRIARWQRNDLPPTPAFEAWRD